WRVRAGIFARRVHLRAWRSTNPKPVCEALFDRFVSLVRELLADAGPGSALGAIDRAATRYIEEREEVVVLELEPVIDDHRHRHARPVTGTTAAEGDGVEIQWVILSVDLLIVDVDLACSNDARMLNDQLG